MRPAASTVRAAAAGFVLLVVLPGCETSADKSARLEKQEESLPAEKGLKVSTLNPNVKVIRRAVLTDANGTAAVVTLRADGRAAMAGVPIAIDVRGAKRAAVFKNNEPGTEAALVSASVLAPGRDLTWVHDQVPLGDVKATSVRVRVGEAKGKAPARLPELKLSELKLTRDATSGIEGVGKVTNSSTIEQRILTMFAVARRGGKIVAAGRAVVRKLKPGKTARFSVFFIGNPLGAKVSVAAPPTVLG